MPELNKLLHGRMKMKFNMAATEFLSIDNDKPVKLEPGELSILINKAIRIHFFCLEHIISSNFHSLCKLS